MFLPAQVQTAALRVGLEALARNPSPIYQHWRKLGPHRSALLGGAIIVADYHSAKAVLKNRKASVDRIPSYEARFASSDVVRMKPLFDLLGMTLLFNDATHEEWRSAMSPFFSGRAIAQLETELIQEIERLISTSRAEGTFDIVELAKAVPEFLIAKLLGIPPSFFPVFRRCAECLGDFIGNPMALGNVAAGAAAKSAAETLNNILFDIVVLKKGSPGNDMISSILASDLPFSIKEWVPQLALLLIAGTLTTSGLLARGTHYLLTESDAWNTLLNARSDKGTMSKFVQEMARIISPTQFTGRIAASTIELGDVVVKPGTGIVLVLGSANIDESVFRRPHAIDLARPSENHHLAFGSGTHVCLGSWAAELEATVFWRTLAQECPSLELVTPPWKIRRSTNLAFPSIGSLVVKS